MDLFERNTEPQLLTRAIEDDEVTSEEDEGPARPSIWLSPRRLAKIAALVLLPLVLLGVGGFFGARYWLRHAAMAALPQVDGQLAIVGLQGPVTVSRDAHGIPHIQAGSMDDLLVAQGFVTASDRLFQMDLLRRHAAGELAEILGPSLLTHDRLQRTLQVRASADRAVTAMPAEQLHELERYADGVNQAMALEAAHLPIEFRVLRYQPAKWTPRDSVLVELSMFQDLTNSFPVKIAREELQARLPPEQEAQLAADLYPVGSWRDHPPTSPVPDLSVPGPIFEDIPLDESQLRAAADAPTIEGLTASVAAWATRSRDCEQCVPGSNNWVVSGAHTASGKPLLSNDMHLAATVPGIWYEADLSAKDGDASEFHVSGVTVPGLPLIVVGHNAHIAWGFTNLGADVQDVYVETLRGTGAGQQFQATDGSWQPVTHAAETIEVRGGKAQGFDVAMTKHGDALTPILNQVSPLAAARAHVLSLRWTVYDPAVLTMPTRAVNSAHDWASFLAAFSAFGGPGQNAVYADDQGHIGYHAVGKIPLRGAAVNPAAAGLPGDVAAPVAAAQTGAPLGQDANPLGQTEILAPSAPTVAQLSGPISALPVVPTLAREWTGYIPFDQLPQVFDPAGGVIATANARVTADDYKYPIALNWAAPYRNERIWHLLAHRTGMTAADMLTIQMDVYSEFDHVLAQRLAYALDESMAHPAQSLTAVQKGALKQAADLLRSFDGRMRVDSAAAAIVASAHEVLWPMLLEPYLRRVSPAGKNAKAPAADAEIASLYSWGEKDYALEQVLMHTPPRWLPKQYANWNDFLTAAIERGLVAAHAPVDLSKWRYGSIHKLDFEHPIFDQSPALQYVYGLPTGTGPLPQSGDGQTIKQVGRAFGPSERFTADMADLDGSTLNLIVGESGNPRSEWFMDQFPAWYHGTTFAMPFSDAAVSAAARHRLTLVPASK